MVSEMAAQALMSGEEFNPVGVSADQQLEMMMRAHRRERKQMQMSSGVRSAQRRSKSKATDAQAAEIQEEGTPKRAIQVFTMVPP